MPAINFHNQSANFLPDKITALTSWLINIAKQNAYYVEKLNYIFCSDQDLLSINQQYLNHDYYTDIITFDLSEKKGTLIADIYISIERVQDNAKMLNEEFEHEFLRVLAHGILHLIGYNDKSEQQQQLMRKKEDMCIENYLNNFK